MIYGACRVTVKLMYVVFLISFLRTLLKREFIMSIPLRFFIISFILAISNCIFIPNMYAQFTIKENFHGNTVGSSIILGGTPAAYLTAGTVDPVNDGWLRLTNDAFNQKGYAYIDKSF